MELEKTLTACPSCHEPLTVWATSTDGTDYYGCAHCGISFGALE